MALDRTKTFTGVITGTAITGHYFIPRQEGVLTASQSNAGKLALTKWLSGYGFRETGTGSLVVKIRDTIALPGPIGAGADGAAGNSTVGLHMYMVTGVTRHGETTYGRLVGDRLEHTTAGSKIVGLSGIPIFPKNPDGDHTTLGDEVFARRVYATKAGAPATTVTPTNAQWFLVVADGATTIASGSNALSLPQPIISVASGAAVASGGGKMLVTTSDGPQVVTYTGVSTNDITGCTGGTGIMATGGAVTQPALLPNNTATTVNVNVADGSFTATVPPHRDTAGRAVVEFNLLQGESVKEDFGDNVIGALNDGGFSLDMSGTGVLNYTLKGQ